MDYIFCNPGLFQKVIEQINAANEIQLQELLFAILNRRRQLHPDWEPIFMSLPRDPQLRKKELDNLLPLLYNSPK